MDRGYRLSAFGNCRLIEVVTVVAECQEAPGGERGYVVRHDGRLAPLEAG
jgi:hypothetical protein